MKILIVLLIIVFGFNSIMARQLTAIIEPMSNKVAWYPLLEWLDSSTGTVVVPVEDYSGNGRDLFGMLSPDNAVLENPSLNGWPSMHFEPSDPLLYDSTPTIAAKHFFVIAKYDGGSTFAVDSGLISDRETNTILTGDSGTTKFINVGFTGFNYYKSQTSYTQSDQQAPITQFELIEMSTSAGVTMDSIRLGQDQVDTLTQWDGRIIEPLIFSAVLSAEERKRVNLYYDLKYALWKRSGVVQYEINYPDSFMFPELPYARYREVPLDWSSVTIKHVYEDEGASFSDTSDGPVQLWEIEYTGLTQEEAEIFDAFNDAVRRKHTFNFTAKDGTVHTGVRLAEYQRDHEANRSWVNSVTLTLAKYQ